MSTEVDSEDPDLQMFSMVLNDSGDLVSLQETVSTLEEQVRQVTREKEELEDMLVQEQLKNKMPQDVQLEAAITRVSTLEEELQAMASKCEEWRRKARVRVGELNAFEVQELLQEHLEDVDHTGVVGLKAEVERLRAELARSEVQRLELFKLQQRSGSPRWEKEEEGLVEQMRELSIGYQISMNEGGSPRWTTPLSSILTDSKAETEEGDGEDVVSQLLELGEATLASSVEQEDFDHLVSAKAAAEARAEAAELRCAQHLQRVRDLETQLALISGNPDPHPIKRESSPMDAAAEVPCPNGSCFDFETDDTARKLWSPERESTNGSNGESPFLETGHTPFSTPLPDIGEGREGGGGGPTESPSVGPASEAYREPPSVGPPPGGPTEPPSVPPPPGGSLPLNISAGSGLAGIGEELERREAEGALCSHSASNHDIKELLTKVEAQNKTTHRVLGVILAIPMLVGACILLGPLTTKWWRIRKQGMGRGRGGSSSSATSTSTMSGSSSASKLDTSQRDSHVILQLGEKSPQDRMAKPR